MDGIQVEHEYLYRKRWVALACVSILSGVLACGSLLEALTADRHQWLGFAIFGSAFGLSIFALWRRRRSRRRRIAFTATGVLLPQGRWRAGESFVAYRDITDLRFVRHVGVASGEVTDLYLHCPHGDFRIARDDLSDGHFHEVCDLLLDRVSPALTLCVGPPYWLNEANLLDRHGEWDRAFGLYKRAAEALQGHPDGVYAENCMRRIQERRNLARDDQLA